MYFHKLCLPILRSSKIKLLNLLNIEKVIEHDYIEEKHIKMGWNKKTIRCKKKIYIFLKRLNFVMSSDDDDDV